ncbi:hypothetical protein [Oceanobacter antarcticus]|uniref:Uncharacterized protein n=1 Tax=Oceanobacter antarcticus TaxID=3133425 RepID=A0ABW8NDN5_9GAMM
MLILAKILITFLTVVLLARVAEQMSPRHAGLLAGFPLGTGIALYFFGWQQGTDFAATSAVFTLSGLTSAVCLAWGYWQVIRRHTGLHWVPVAMISGLLCFFASSWLLQQLPPHRGLGLLVVVGAIVCFHTLFRAIDETAPLSSDPYIGADWFHKPLVRLLFRAAMATFTILLITGLADVLGPQRAGLLAAFPVSFFPLLLILHLGQGASVVARTIRHYPDGLGALVVYALCVSYTYPVLGLHWGTVVCLVASLLYLFVYGYLRQRLLRPAA